MSGISFVSVWCRKRGCVRSRGVVRPRGRHLARTTSGRAFGVAAVVARRTLPPALLSQPTTCSSALGIEMIQRFGAAFEQVGGTGSAFVVLRPRREGAASDVVHDPQNLLSGLFRSGRGGSGDQVDRMPDMKFGVCDRSNPDQPGHLPTGGVPTEVVVEIPGARSGLYSAQ